jgi:Na+-driven multidrug efflux pump
MCCSSLQATTAKQLAAFTILLNLLYMNENIGYGFGVTIRTRINQLLGQQRFQEAKAFFTMSMVGLLALTPVVTLGYCLCRHLIVDFYAGNNPEVGVFLEMLLLVQGLTCCSIIFLMPVFMVSRSTNQAVINIQLDLTVIVGLQSLLALLLLHCAHPQCSDLLLVANACFALANCLVCVKLFIMDWKKECSDRVSQIQNL